MGAITILYYRPNRRPALVVIGTAVLQLRVALRQRKSKPSCDNMMESPAGAGHKRQVPANDERRCA
jgi:hypothetical protein